MKILIADDDPFIRRLLEFTLLGWGHEVIAVADGMQAWRVLERVEPPCLIILDWVMPEIDGLELCRRVRSARAEDALYLILLTSNAEKSDVVAGLAAGANDYVTKPFDDGELYARIQVGLRMLELQRRLADRIEEISQAMVRVRQLQGLLPICAYCKSIRNDQNYWQRVEHYICAHADVKFSHGICPTCLKQVLANATPELVASTN
jgi:phosphoserine phosphatase RsbU/P